MKARKRVAIAGPTINQGRYPGLRASKDKRIALKRTATEINTGCVGTRESLSSRLCQIDSTIRKSAINQSESVQLPNLYLSLLLNQRFIKSAAANAKIPSERTKFRQLNKEKNCRDNQRINFPIFNFKNNYKQNH